MRKNRVALSSAVLLFAAGASLAGSRPGPQDAYGPRFYPVPHSRLALRHRPGAGADEILRWNEIAINASGLDHTAVLAGENRVFGEQFGPGRAARAMAIVHVAIFDAVNSIAGGYKSYSGIGRAPGGASMEAAVAQAAHDTLSSLYPSQAPTLDDLLTEDLDRIRDGRSLSRGVEVGRRAAAAILAKRADDHSQHPEDRMGIEFLPNEDAGKWRQDPISQAPIALGSHWGGVTPFVMRSGSQFRVPPPPAMDSAAYAAAFNEVKSVGGDGITTPTIRTPDQAFAAVYWAYDGTPSLCAPPRLYNQITTQIADQQGTNDPAALARLLALVNVSMADAGIAAWESKFFYQFWRPVTGIREADAGTGTTGAGDNNPATSGDRTFSPLGAPASNLHGPNFTPPFPAYPSGHATFGGALFETLRNFYRRDRIAFTFVSDEFDGVTIDNKGAVRALVPRSFSSLSEAEEENGESRIYLGIHWSFDKTEGIAQGRRIAEYVFKNAFIPDRENERD
ncbi:MAG: phosphatase PAP2 family protein [Acidobacteria bacterium]|nr:phosphatase PAP2 family protein [Acidobacteriota bacterium]